MNRIQKNKGFTIIEVVLVLAIAGLIFLMVFVALPALQRSQRDTARKGDVAIVGAAVTTFTSNNRGELPTNDNFAEYTTEMSGNTTSVIINEEIAPDSVSLSDEEAANGTIIVTFETTCGTSTPSSQALAAGNAKQYTAVTKLESGSGTYYCQNY